VQGSIIDVLMPPLAPGELVLAYVGGALMRALMIGLALALAIWLLPRVSLTPMRLWAMLYYGISGSMLLALMGILTGLWSEKFDHAAAITNFVVTPLSMLSGTFFSIDRLPDFWRSLCHFNPFFHIIDGFRYGFTGHADGNLMAGGVALLIINALLWGLNLHLLRTGWRVRA
jgi:ABC-2 type transport system permease protein